MMMKGKKYIIAYLERHVFTDILDRDFIVGFIEETGARFQNVNIGAPKCKAAGRALSSLYKDGTLTRVAIGLPAGDSALGFPKWVYSYSIKT